MTNYRFAKFSSDTTAKTTKIWLVYVGSLAELSTMHHWCREHTLGGTMFGTAVIAQRTPAELFLQPFGFDRLVDAMRFRLTFL
jgi:hypothetical protein